MFEILVSEMDEDLVYGKIWTIAKSGYAVKNFKIDGKWRPRYLHRIIGERMGFDMNFDVYHQDRNLLNNCRDNLTSVIRTGYKGVYKYETTAKYKVDRVYFTANIRVKGEQIYLGVFGSARDAAIAYNESALKYLGQDAYLNEIPEII